MNRSSLCPVELWAGRIKKGRILIYGWALLVLYFVRLIPGWMLLIESISTCGLETVGWQSASSYWVLR